MIGKRFGFTITFYRDNSEGAGISHQGLLVSTKNTNVTYSYLRLNWLSSVWNVNISPIAFFYKHYFIDKSFIKMYQNLSNQY